RWGGIEITALGTRELDRWRRRAIGIVFQDFNLFAGLSPLDNVLLPATFDAIRAPAPMRDRARMLLDRVGVDPDRRSTAVLSRGEMQRVAIARALLFVPPAIVADEPTASLDAKNGPAVASLLYEVARASGASLLVATHDRDVLARVDRVAMLVSGRLYAAEAVAR